MDFNAEIILVVSGLFVGFINTLAGGAVVISLTIFLMLGLPVTVANGTNRLPVIMQNLASSINFRRKKLLDVKTGLKLAAPLALGSVIGAQIASTIDEVVFELCMAGILVIMLIFMLLSPDSILKGSDKPRKLTVWYYVWFLAIGFYGGYIYVGLGYMLLAATIAGLGYDIVRANAIKGFVLAVTTPLSFVVFAINGQVDYYYGLLHGAGNILGAFIASSYASNMGVRFLKWFIIIVIVVLLIDIMGLISLQSLINRL